MFTLSTATLPVLIHMLSNLEHIVARGQAHATAKQLDPAALTNYRLAPDMLPLTRQVLIACDAAKNGVARVSGIQAPVFEDNEQTFDELKARIAKTLAWLHTVPATALDGKEEVEVTFPVGKEGTRTMKAGDYLKLWTLPNMYFHVTMTYAILRHNGVDLGKRDYLLGSAAAA